MWAPWKDAAIKAKIINGIDAGRRGVLIALLVAVGACASAPVQEMSNARQAIMAAEEAGAATEAPDLLSEARQLLSGAEKKLQKHAYSSAKRDAVKARERALEALSASESGEGEQ